MAHRHKAFVVSATAVAIFAAALFSSSQLHQRVEGFLFDWAMKTLVPARAPSPNVSVILVDEASLKALAPVVGRWPWPRAVFADLLGFLDMGKPKAVVMDILFTETQAEDRRDDDRALIEATQHSGNVYHALDTFAEGTAEPVARFPVGFAKRFGIRGLFALRETAKLSAEAPMPGLWQASRGVGDVSLSRDIDGITRRIRPLRAAEGASYPTLGLAPFVGDSSVRKLDRSIRVGNRLIPRDADGFCRPWFYRDFHAYSISGILSSLQRIRAGEIEQLPVHPSEFQGRVVFVGTAAAGLFDLRSTPTDRRTPGVLVHATFASNLLDGCFLSPRTPAVSLLLAALLALATSSVICLTSRDLLRLCAPPIIAAGYAAFWLHRLGRCDLFDLSTPGVAIFLASSFALAIVYAREAREKRHVKKLFARYVSPEVLHEMAESPGEYVHAGRGREVIVTVLFCDVRGFTSFSDGRSPEEVVALLNCLFSHLTGVIHRHRGSIDKYIGDAIMAYWGAPVETPDQADLAVEAATGMLAALPDVNRDLAAMDIDHEVRIGIGINTGPAILRSVGSQVKIDYTLIGDAVNVASRLEGLTKAHQVPIVISESTRLALGKTFPIVPLGTVPV